MKKAVYVTSGEPTKSIEIDHGLGIEHPAFAFYDTESNQVKIDCDWKVFGDADKIVITFEKEMNNIKTILVLDADEQ